MLTDAEADTRELQALTDTHHAAERAMCDADPDMTGDSGLQDTDEELEDAVLNALDAISDFRDDIGVRRFLDAFNGID